MQQERIELIRPQMGTARALTVRRYGTSGKGPKAYLQAALHADELPGVIALHHLEPVEKSRVGGFETLSARRRSASP